jgi:uncharacterized SAM-binding protein YcdF (DUF218 family)
MTLFFVLEKVISRLLFPVPLAIGGMILGLLLWRFGLRRAGITALRQRRIGMGLCIAALGFLTLLSVEPVSDTLLWSLESRHAPLQDVPAEAEAIAVLGAGHAERPGFSAWSNLEERSVARVGEAVRLSRQSDLPLLFSGYAGAGDIANASMQRDAAVELGLETDRTRLFPEARDTKEEAQAVAAARPGATVVLVTSANHMPRALYLFEQAGLDPVPAPTGYLAADRDYALWSFFPSGEALYRARLVWYEWLGFLWARIGE